MTQPIHETVCKDRMAPKWARDLVRLLPIRPQFVFSGNIRDYFLFPGGDGGYGPVSFYDGLWQVLESMGFDLMLLFDPVDYIRIYPPLGKQDETRSQLVDDLKIKLNEDGRSPADLKTLLATMRRAVHDKDHRITVLLDYASRIPVRSQSVEKAEHDFYVGCEKLAQEAVAMSRKGTPVHNPVIWLVNRAQDLPAWYTLDNDVVHSVEIAKPDHDQRIQVGEVLLDGFSGAEQCDEIQRDAYTSILADMTNGFSIRNMIEVAELARIEDMGVEDIDDAIRSYKTGDPSLENPWASDGLKKKIREAEKGTDKKSIYERVMGQDRAVEHALDILKRSVVGLTGAQAASSQGRPRGVLFFAGPTGVGKTELAKTLTEHIFGNEQAYIRFDMSEFSAEHSDQRLLGAPPGYVGYDAGGELTNAVRERPFSLILFDEIEKAHPRILDKFLQILEDGRLTSGQGETVYFSESILVFTSNKGMSRKERDAAGNVVEVPVVEPGADYDTVKKEVSSALEDYFTKELGRPEILNRFGQNIVIFNFIQGEVAEKIFDKMLKSIAERVRDEHRCDLVVEEEPRRQLLEWATEDLSMGGRGIGNQLELTFINPLAREMFKTDLEGKRQIRVTSVSRVRDEYRVTIECE